MSHRCRYQVACSDTLRPVLRCWAPNTHLLARRPLRVIQVLSPSIPAKLLGQLAPTSFPGLSLGGGCWPPRVRPSLRAARSLAVTTGWAGLVAAPAPRPSGARQQRCGSCSRCTSTEGILGSTSHAGSGVQVDTGATRPGITGHLGKRKGLFLEVVCLACKSHTSFMLTAHWSHWPMTPSKHRGTEGQSC